MTDNVVPLRFNVEQVGKHVKASKKRFTWDISLNGRQHSVVLDFSFISGKVKVTVDRKILLQNQLPANTSFQYPFTLDGNALNVIQQGDNFQLRINNKVFSHLYNQMKTNKQFKKYEDQVRDFRVDDNQFQAKKLTLNIGGVGGGMKKKPKNQSTTQGHNWNAFGQDQMSGFPSYFEGQSVSTSASSAKFQQKVQKKAPMASLLDQNSQVSTSNKKQQTPQNILDFQAQIQKSPSFNTSTSKPNQKDQFSTMQLLFNTMSVDPSKQNQPKAVVINNSQVDFFSSPNEEPNLTVVKPQPQNQSIDFFSQMGNVSVSNNVNNSSTMGMFATSSMAQQGNKGFGTNQPMNFNTTSGVGLKGQNQSFNLNMGMNLGGNTVNQNINIQGMNSNSALNNNWSLQQQKPTEFNTMQHLFTTNSMGMNMGQNFSMSSNQTSTNVPVNTNISLAQKQSVNTQNASINMNMQHFATQQIPTQNFASNFNISSPQAFGTQNFGNLQSNFDFKAQQNTTKSVSLSNTGLPNTTPNTPVSVPVDVNSINLNDFSTMQQLFKTNSLNMQPTFGQQPTQSTSSPLDLGFAQQFSTGSLNQNQTNLTQNNLSLGQSSNVGSNNINLNMNLNTQATTNTSSSQSPNTMFMNTYGGSSSSSGGFGGFDMGFGGSSQQFNTSTAVNLNGGMMKKQSTSSAPVTNVQSNNSEGNDLI